MESPIIQKISQNSIKAGLYTNVVQVSLTPSGLTFTTFLTLRHLCPAKLFLPPPPKKNLQYLPYKLYYLSDLYFCKK